jgi:hypothetical protein
MLLPIILALIVGGPVVAIALTCLLTAGKEFAKDNPEKELFPIPK